MQIHINRSNIIFTKINELSLIVRKTLVTFLFHQLYFQYVKRSAGKIKNTMNYTIVFLPGIKGSVLIDKCKENII